MYDASLAHRQGLDHAQCRSLAESTLASLKAKKVRCEDFDALNFETCFRIYSDQAHQCVALD